MNTRLNSSLDKKFDEFWFLYKSSKGYGKVFNVGINKTYKIKKIYEILKNKLKFNVKLKIEKKRVRPKSSEVDKLLCDNKLFNPLFLGTQESPLLLLLKTP